MSSDFFKSKSKPKTQKFEQACDIANRFANSKVPGILDQIETDIRSESGDFVWDRELAEKTIGQHLALAYAMGALDKTDNVAAKSRLIL